MKLRTLYIVVFICVIGTCVKAQALPEETNTGGASEPVADESPEFPGGVVAMMEFVKANIKYPQRALDAKISGKCQLKFSVNSDGSISDISILDGMANCPECETEAIRVVKSMPKWKPGKLAGKAVALYYNLPINFSLPKK